MKNKKCFRFLTVVLSTVLLVMLSVNAYAASGNAITKDGITVQLFTDKASYTMNESVKATVQVENNTGKEVFVFANVKIPEGASLVSEKNAYDALLKEGES